jgi:hypothetical protein
VALSRTDPRGASETVREVERLFLDAIEAAERLIYVETQYFSSARICAALVQRLRAPGPPVDVVVVVNERAEALKEELAVGLRQAENLDRLRAAVAGTPHALGLYFSRCEHPDDRFRTTYIHSKVLIVDDRFLSVGSANLTNRSMGVDSELHVSWEVARDDAAGRALERAIRRVRVSLLAEHAGVRGPAVRRLFAPGGLVSRLDGLAAQAGARLAGHGPPTPTQQAVLDLIDPDDLPFDPAGPDADPDAVGRGEPADERRARPARPWRLLVPRWRTRPARGQGPPAPVTPARPAA